MWLCALDTKIDMGEFKESTEADKFCYVLEKYGHTDGQ
jgi:hypothetical protein